MRNRLLPLIAAGAAALLSPVAATAAGAESASGASAGAPSALSMDLARIRQATARFRDIDVALSEGYIIPPPEHCVTAESEGDPKQLGAMGVHLIRPDLLGITAVTPRVNGVGTNVDFTQPSVLVYEPQGNGKYELVAVENLVFAQAWHAAGNTERPSFHGYQYYYMIDNPLTPADEAHGFEPHYELHIWLYRENPAGMFMQFNRRVTCPGHAH